MNTPIVDFVNKYRKSEISRLHMPGHKGMLRLGFEDMDITEIKGADSLYHADGIIAESENNASRIFETARTFYSTEGSTHCIKSMVALAVMNSQNGKRPMILALRNVHKAFINACALVDIDVDWIFPNNDNESIASCQVSLKTIEEAVINGINTNNDNNVAALYMTSPDYLGNIYPVKEIADICHKHGILLLVDNAHGAYLKFLEQSLHPMDMGADMCSDSAHKTLPVLTGGAYLHISNNAPKQIISSAKDTMALFGSTSPSYLILESLDLCNRYMSDEIRKNLMKMVEVVEKLKKNIYEAGFVQISQEVGKITIYASKSGCTGDELADKLREYKVECEYSDNDFVVLMLSTDSTVIDCERIIDALRSMDIKENINNNRENDNVSIRPERVMSIRNAVFSKQECIPVLQAAGRICAMSVVSCPPAIPVIVSGELVSEQMIRKLIYNQIETINVCK